jgi:RNA polymerase sigma-70 factor, ECF subfamily
VTPGEETLKALMIRSLAGEEVATRDLLTELSGRLRCYFRRRTRADADVEDLVQETLLAIHAKRETFDRNELLTAWVFAIARHKLIDWYRKQNTKHTVPLEDAHTLFIESAYDEETAAPDVTRLLETLPVKQAAAIRCMKLDGLSAVEAAKRTGQSVTAVKVSVHRGLKKLAHLLRGLRE